MLKKFAVVGLVLLFAGTAVLGWVIVSGKRAQQETAFYKLKYGADLQECFSQYNEWLKLPPEDRTQLPFVLGEKWKTRTETQTQRDQRGRLKADMDRLAVSEKEVYLFADVLYGANWQNEVSDYKKRKERNEFILTNSIVCAAVGGAVSICCLLVWIGRLITRELCGAWGFLAAFVKARRKSEDETAGEATTNPGKTQGEQKRKFLNRSRLKKNSKVLTNSGWQSFGANSANRRGPGPAEAEALVETGQNGGSGKAASLFSDENAFTSGSPLMRIRRSGFNSGASQVNRTRNVQKTPAQDSPGDLRGVQDSLKAQTESMEKQMAEFKQMTQSVQQATLEQSRPLDNAIKELAEQMVAIREYAACQQERVKKFQEGYDWNITKSFCLRIIHCIDNLESRIARLSEDDVEAVHLKEVRDELIFLLEAGGVEQFGPDINSDYRGQERYAEAVREREDCDDPDQAGRIAEVIRPGYQYFIDDENSKIIRSAQVKLFGVAVLNGSAAGP
jgi:molecular chaperone GrpE (heat shock protein)